MTPADILWGLAYALGAFGFGCMLHELWRGLRPWLRLRRWRDRHPIIKDWNR